MHAGSSEFIFVCCTEYDQNLDIQSSMDQDFILKIDRMIEPNSINVLDCYQLNPNKEGYGDYMAILSQRDDEFFIDKINPLAKYHQLKLSKVETRLAKK